MAEDAQDYEAETGYAPNFASKPDFSATPPGKRESKGRTGLSLLRISSNEVNSPSSNSLRFSMHSNDGNSMGRSTSRLSFFRTLIGQRNDDYRSDAPQEVQFQRTQGQAATGDDTKHRSNRTNRTKSSNRSSRWSLRPSNDLNRSLGCRLRCQLCLKSTFTPSPGCLDGMSNLVHSKLWHGGLLFFTLVLLFGAQVQELWVPKKADTFFDVLFTVDFVYLFLDIIMRCFIEPEYFYFQPCKKGDSSSAWGRNCRLGSFMFYCDLISTCLLFYDISYINKQLFNTTDIAIVLDGFGLPVDGIEEINTALPIRWQPALLVTILRTTRVARFIRASTVVKTSSFVNWYWFIQWFNPSYYFQSLHRRRMEKRQSETEADLNEGSSERSTDISTDRRKQLIRRTSWRGVALDAKAVVQAREQGKEKEKGLRGMVKSALVFVGILPDEEKKLKERIVAATKIQRAWRNHAVSESNHGEGLVHDAWHGDRTASDAVIESSYEPIRKKKKIGKSIRRSFDLPGRNPDKGVQESQVGSAMRELTGQRVAVGVIVAMILTILFTYSENDATRPSTMIVLHTQTANDDYASKSLDAARASSIPDLYFYQTANGTNYTFEIEGQSPEELRDREKLYIWVTGEEGERPFLNGTTTGYFSNRQLIKDQALVELLTTFFILFIWFFGVTAFAGPVMTLVVIPIERMVRLLGMLMVDPLGYQSSSRYKNFVNEEDELTKNSRWTKEVLKGMETSFLMDTITRIGSLMKVGFGSAGVEIIRNNLEKGQRKDTLFLNSQGSTVACIFLFCDIRQFTDATESLQEEVFLFTNKIAAVVHSICHSYGGSANKNVGDAFLLSWLLEDEGPSTSEEIYAEGIVTSTTDTFTAKNNQADKALLSVVKICIGLQHDQYYIEDMSQPARDALLAKLSTRKGPVVQMGFGLHAGKAIQGALGSQRKIDATYVSEAVERAEFLESSTKKYGVKMLMSDNFHRLLHPRTRRRCRKVDQILINNEDDEESLYDREVMELFTFDMDIDALWRKEEEEKMSDVDSINDSVASTRGSKTERRGMLKPRRRSLRRLDIKGLSVPGLELSEELTGRAADVLDAAAPSSRGNVAEGGEDAKAQGPPELVLPKGPALYNASVWQSEEMRKIRARYVDGIFFQQFSSGLQSFYAKDWDHAKQCFHTILERFEDGPSKYFLKQIEDHGGVPPRKFLGYGTA